MRSMICSSTNGGTPSSSVQRFLVRRGGVDFGVSFSVIYNIMDEFEFYLNDIVNACLEKGNVSSLQQPLSSHTVA